MTFGAKFCGTFTLPSLFPPLVDVVRLLRGGQHAHTRRTVPKVLLACIGVRKVGSKPKTWTKTKSQSNSLLKFDPNSSERVNKPIILLPPNEHILASSVNVNKSLKEAEETLLQEQFVTDKPRKFRSNTPLIYNPQKLKDKEEAKGVNAFVTVCREILRHTAKKKGLKILPDGFVRVSDIMRHEFFKDYTFELFADHVLKDPAKEFDLAHLPELIDGKLQDVWWVRAKRAHTIPVFIIEGCRQLPPSDSEYGKQGILLSETELDRIRLYRTLENVLFETMHFPSRKERLCVSVDSELAARKGVKFFMTQERKTFAVGNADNIIPPESLLGATLLEIKCSNLLHRLR
ncbi:tRNA 2'-phosphotransferase 1 [Psilocybe cubensis]|uniref:tRNA 2'-phosphotransferase 1 n=2 Tax=Psilocybe cubensis TaxID=181762 RepID=A0ACB8GVP5_PSICU|nr:tRNA 2'-phosphotransferase 1 [Psilocybe cubensis]KAH9479693.1 tRNA 2'-phosphotransferase 1 [Psilocybe cubensis]